MIPGVAHHGAAGPGEILLDGAGDRRVETRERHARVDSGAARQDLHVARPFRHRLRQKPARRLAVAPAARALRGAESRGPEPGMAVEERHESLADRSGRPQDRHRNSLVRAHIRPPFGPRHRTLPPTGTAPRRCATLPSARLARPATLRSAPRIPVARSRTPRLEQVAAPPAISCSWRDAEDRDLIGTWRGAGRCGDFEPRHASELRTGEPARANMSRDALRPTTRLWHITRSARSPGR